MTRGCQRLQRGPIAGGLDGRTAASGAEAMELRRFRLQIIEETAKLLADQS